MLTKFSSDRRQWSVQTPSEGNILLGYLVRILIGTFQTEFNFNANYLDRVNLTFGIMVIESNGRKLAALDFLAAVTTGPGGGIPDKPGFTAFR
jgi:hypothetical protein